jgi:methylenetetrahydrofolate reductase (NADPH)
MTTRMQRVLEAGHFAVTAEINPPVGPNAGAVERQIELLRGYADAYNVTDNQAARVHSSGLAVSIMIQQAGLEPVLQLTCRDRNRLGLQSDLLGAAMFGIGNVLALSGDDPVWGDHPQTKSVYDIDSMNLVRMARMMARDGVFENGAEIPKIRPDLFVGAAANPFAPPFDYRPHRLAKKIVAGAQFIQTQWVFNLDRFRTYMARIVDMGLHEQVHILAGIGPIRSLRAAEYMAAQVAGMDVPDDIVRRMDRPSKEEQAEAGLDIAVEMGEAVREIEGVAGIHIMAVSWAAAIPQIIERLGLQDRPEVGGS